MTEIELWLPSRVDIYVWAYYCQFNHEELLINLSISPIKA